MPHESECPTCAGETGAGGGLPTRRACPQGCVAHDCCVDRPSIPFMYAPGGNLGCAFSSPSGLPMHVVVYIQYLLVIRFGVWSEKLTF